MRGWFARLHDDVDLYRYIAKRFVFTSVQDRTVEDVPWTNIGVFNMIDGRDDFRMTIILIANVVLYAFMPLSASYIYGENYNV